MVSFICMSTGTVRLMCLSRSPIWDQLKSKLSWVDCGICCRHRRCTCRDCGGIRSKPEANHRPAGRRKAIKPWRDQFWTALRRRGTGHLRGNADTLPLREHRQLPWNRRHHGRRSAGQLTCGSRRVCGKRGAFPLAACKTLRVSHSSRRPQRRTRKHALARQMAATTAATNEAPTAGYTSDLANVCDELVCGSRNFTVYSSVRIL